jgi:hypothetical protein
VPYPQQQLAALMMSRGILAVPPAETAALAGQIRARLQTLIDDAPLG